MRIPAVGSPGRAVSAAASELAAALAVNAEDLVYAARAVLLRGFAAGALQDALDDRVAAPTPPEIVIAGRDPIHVVLIGRAGLALGGSAGRRTDAIGDRLADRLHAATGRGIRLTTLRDPPTTRLPLRRGHQARRSRSREGSRASPSLEPDLVVYAQGPEEVFHASRRALRSRVRSLLRWSERTASKPPPVVLAGVPAPRVRTVSGRLADRQCRAVERDLVRLAAPQGPRVSVLPVPTYPSLSARIHLDPDHSATVAREISRRFLQTAPRPGGDAEP